MNQFTSKLNELIKSNNGREIDIAYQAYEIIQSSGDTAPKLLKRFLYYSADDSAPQKTEKEIISDDVLGSTLANVADNVDSWLDDMIASKPGENEFYDRLWDYICNSKHLKSKTARAVALYWVWMDPRIPYFKLKSGIKMTSDRFASTNKKINTDLLKARFAIFSTYKTRTEEASVLLDLINGLNTPEEKAVLLAYMIRSVELRTVERFISDKNKDTGS